MRDSGWKEESPDLLLAIESGEEGVRCDAGQFHGTASIGGSCEALLALATEQRRLWTDRSRQGLFGGWYIIKDKR